MNTDSCLSSPGCTPPKYTKLDCLSQRSTSWAQASHRHQCKLLLQSSLLSRWQWEYKCHWGIPNPHSSTAPITLSHVPNIKLDTWADRLLRNLQVNCSNNHLVHQPYYHPFSVLDSGYTLPPLLVLITSSSGTFPPISIPSLLSLSPLTPSANSSVA